MKSSFRIGSSIRFWLLLLALGWVALPAQQAQAADQPDAQPLSSGTAARDLLLTRLGHIGNFVAVVNQEIQGSRGELLERSVGAISISRPMFKWTVEDPYPQVIVSDGKSLTVFDPDLNQAIVRTLESALADTPIALLTRDQLELGADFDVLRLADGAEEVYLLTPLNEDTLYSEIRLRFNSEALEGFGIIDHLGQYTDIRFVDVQHPEEIAEQEFLLQLPPDVDIING